MTARLTVIIPTWNHGALLGECLASLDAQTYRDFEVTVVDDGSTDGSVDRALEGRDLRVLRNDRNAGFAVSANRGLQAAQSEYVMLLNNDVTLAPDCLQRLVDKLDARHVDMVQPLILFRDDPDTIYSAGDRQRINGRPESIGFREKREGFAFDEPVFGVTAAAAIYRRAIFDRVGYLDESFEAYFEDSDLNFRARLAGFEARCIHKAVAWHVGSASQQGNAWRRSCLCFRNHTLLVIKNMPLSLIARHAIPQAREHVHQAGRLVSACRAEFGLLRAIGMYFKMAWSLIIRIPHALLARRTIKQSILAKSLKAQLR